MRGRERRAPRGQLQGRGARAVAPVEDDGLEVGGRVVDRAAQVERGPDRQRRRQRVEGDRRRQLVDLQDVDGAFDPAVAVVDRQGDDVGPVVVVRVRLGRGRGGDRRSPVVEIPGVGQRVAVGTERAGAVERDGLAFVEGGCRSACRARPRDQLGDRRGVLGLRRARIPTCFPGPSPSPRRSRCAGGTWLR